MKRMTNWRWKLYLDTHSKTLSSNLVNKLVVCFIASGRETEERQRGLGLQTYPGSIVILDVMDKYWM